MPLHLVCLLWERHLAAMLRPAASIMEPYA
jgi:hypothetical protein